MASSQAHEINKRRKLRNTVAKCHSKAATSFSLSEFSCACAGQVAPFLSSRPLFRKALESGSLNIIHTIETKAHTSDNASDVEQWQTRRRREWVFVIASQQRRQLLYQAPLLMTANSVNT